MRPRLWSSSLLPAGFVVDHPDVSADRIGPVVRSGTWSRATGRAPVTVRPHRDHVRPLAFDTAGQTVVSVGEEGSSQSSVLGGQRLAEIACGLVRRDLTADEVREYSGNSFPVLPTCPGSRRAVEER